MPPKATLPNQAPIFAFRPKDFRMITFAGEPVGETGTAVENMLRGNGMARRCLAAASFHGDGPGRLPQGEEMAPGATVTEKK
jgi:hypothetical protein